VAGAQSHVQTEEWSRVTGQHEAGYLRLLCGVRPGRAGATVVLLLPHATGVLRAPAVAPLSQLHRTGGHLRPPLRDVRGGASIGAAVLTLLCAEGCESAPAAHRRLLLPAQDKGPRLLHHTRFPWQVGAMERRLGTGAGERPRPARTSRRRSDP
jgi:hypothetical protein